MTSPWLYQFLWIIKAKVTEHFFKLHCIQSHENLHLVYVTKRNSSQFFSCSSNWIFPLLLKFFLTDFLLKPRYNLRLLGLLTFHSATACHHSNYFEETICMILKVYIFKNVLIILSCDTLWLSAQPLLLVLEEGENFV